MHQPSIKQRVLDMIDHDSIVAFLAELVDIPSPTGHELDLAKHIADRLQRSGIEANVDQFGPDRANVIATIEGSGQGPTVMLNGHLDSSYRGNEPELEGIGYKNKAVLVDDQWMYGNGVHNMKNALAQYVGIMEAIVGSGVNLAGDVVLAGVAGEIETAPYGEFEGPEYDGFGVGTSYALENGLTADMCILGEPTANAIGLSNLGVNWVRISTSGTMTHTQHASTAVNAVYKMQKIMEWLRPWMLEYRRRHVFDGIEPACDITAINGGWPWRASRTPVFCDIFLCVRTTPSMTSATVESELREFAHQLKRDDPGLDIEIDFYLRREASEIDPSEPVVVELHRNHVEVFGREPAYRRRTAYMDSSLLNKHGIPTVVYGPSGRVNKGDDNSGWSPQLGEHIFLEDLRLGSQVVAGTVLDICAPHLAAHEHGAE